MRRFTLLVLCLLSGPSLAQDLTEVTTEENIEETTTTEPTEEDVEETKIIVTGSGSVRGRTVTRDDKTHHEFLGVPYAQPPLGALRFRPPVAVR